MQTTVTNSNYATFVKLLTAQYEILFKLPAYGMAASRWTPAGLAAEVTHKLASDGGDKNGQGVQNVRKALKLKNTYGAIREYLHDGPRAVPCATVARMQLEAAAPKMLAALEAVQKWWMETDGYQEGDDADEMPAEVFDAIRFAIGAGRGSVPSTTLPRADVAYIALRTALERIAAGDPTSLNFATLAIAEARDVLELTK